MKSWVVGTAVSLSVSWGSQTLANEAQVEMTKSGTVSNGYLWTASFQRIDGSTCAWIRVENGLLTEVIYDNTVGFCRNLPPEEAQGRFPFTRKDGNRLVFGGVDFDIVTDASSQLSGSWNHVSYDPKFAVDNVVFRGLSTE